MEGVDLPPLIERAGEQASQLFREYFTIHIHNPNTRRFYAAAVGQFFNWCEEHGLELSELQPAVLAAYFEELTHNRSPSTVKQHLTAVRMLMGHFVFGHVLPSNPAPARRLPGRLRKRRGGRTRARQRPRGKGPP